MPDSENGLTTAELLESDYGLTPEALGLDAATFARRVTLWERRAAGRAGASAEQRQAHVCALALRTWQTVLMEEDEKFRAEGDITSEKDVMSRVGQVEKWLTAAELAAGLGTAQGHRRANPAPQFGAWGLEG